MLLLLVELDLVAQLARLAVNSNPREALLADLLEELMVFALAAAHDGGQELQTRALGQLHDLIDDLLARLSANLAPAVVAVRLADARVEQAQVVVDLGNRADRRARIARGRLLIDRDRRREPLDVVDVGLLHLAEELARVRRERLDVAPLALGVNGVEGKRRLAGAREPGDHDQPVARQRQIDVLEVVLARAFDDDRIEPARGAVPAGMGHGTKTRRRSQALQPLRANRCRLRDAAKPSTRP